MSNEIVLFNNSLDDFNTKNEINNSDAGFELFTTLQIFKDEDLSIHEIKSGLIGGSDDCGIDALYLFVNNKYIEDFEDLKIFLNDKTHEKSQIKINFYIYQYKNSNSRSTRVIEKFLSFQDELFDLNMLANEEILDQVDEMDKYKNIISTELIEKIILFKTAWIKLSSSHPEINITYNHVCKHTQTTEDPKYNRKVEKLIKSVKETYFTDSKNTINLETYGVNDLLKLDRQKPEYTLDINLNETPIIIDYKNNNPEENGIGYIASVNIYDFKQFIKDDQNTLRKYLFDSNVRDYQNSTTINKSILQTLDNKGDSDFWWLNNGITILANGGTLAGKKINLKNIQIVNGLQTSYSIFNSTIDESDNRSIFVKIIITDNEEVIDNIIRATNSQNYIHPSVFRATDPIQRNIEEHLKRRNLYYDRRKNYYKNEGKSIKDIISINQMAQAIYAIIFKNPCKARQSPASLTKNDTIYDEIFNRTRSLDVYEKAIVLIRKTEDFLINWDIEENTEDENILLNIKSNYMYVISRILVSVILKTDNYREVDFAAIDVTKEFKEEYFSSINILKDIIKIYISIEENKNTTLTNLAKKPRFSDFISENLVETTLFKNIVEQQL